jgi:hypothetical protein
MQAGRPNSRINSGCKRFELNDAYSFAGEIRQIFAPSRFLNSTDVHEKAEALAISRPFGSLSVDNRVEA